MRIGFSLFFLAIAMTLSGQTELVMSGKTYTNSDDTWLGVNIPRDQATRLIFKNNSISSINRYGYLLQAGDEGARSTNNKLDGSIITGNKFTWTGSDMKVIPHGLFTGHQSNIIAKYNYLKDVPMGIIRKSTNNMTNTSGGVAYNIVKNGAVAMVVKGMSNVNIYNNTFYQERTTSQTWRPLVHIYTNTDNGNYSVAHGTKIYNNIFYTKYQTFAITIDDKESLQGLECDYNVYWCENGPPRFSVAGSTKTFEQWQAMGYDQHSVVMDPKFKDLVNFVPGKRLDFGKDLGAEWKDGLSVNAVWGDTDPAITPQNGKWQVGAVLYAEGNAVIAPVPQPDPAPAPAPGQGNPVVVEGSISFSPNPVKDTLTINNVPGSELRLSIYDFKGNLCMQKGLSAGNSQSVPLSLSTGVYIAYIEKGNEVIQFRKLIVVK